MFDDLFAFVHAQLPATLIIQTSECFQQQTEILLSRLWIKLDLIRIAIVVCGGRLVGAARRRGQGQHRVSIVPVDLPVVHDQWRQPTEQLEKLLFVSGDGHVVGIN